MAICGVSFEPCVFESAAGKIHGSSYEKGCGRLHYTRQNAGEKTDDGADCNQHSKETNSGFRSENLERGRALIKRNLAPIKPRTCA